MTTTMRRSMAPEADRAAVTTSGGQQCALNFAAAPDQPERLAAGASLLRGFAVPAVADLLDALHALQAVSAFRQMVTPGGFPMSVAVSNCGALGWTSSRQGYRYTARAPDTGQAWPPMPEAFWRLARDAAAHAGFPHFDPDACLINRYRPGARLTLHQDRNERDFSQPIVSVSLGMSATFVFGGLSRTGKTAKLPLHHGDVVVWGGPDRLRYHGVLPLPDLPHPLLGRQRINLTFRKAG